MTRLFTLRTKLRETGRKFGYMLGAEECAEVVKVLDQHVKVSNRIDKLVEKKKAEKIMFSHCILNTSDSDSKIWFNNKYRALEKEIADLERIRQ